MNKKEMLRAVDFALAQQWDEAHHIVQQHETSEIASWIHAVLHKIEGDTDNSLYWYRRAGKLQHAQDAPEQELQTIKLLLAQP